MTKPDKNTQDDKRSLDSKLMLAFYVTMYLLIPLEPITEPINQLYFAVTLLASIIVISALHKYRTHWQWSGISALSIPRAAASISSIYFFVFAGAFMIVNGGPPDDFSALIKNIGITGSWAVILKAAEKPQLTPFFLMGLGAVLAKVARALNLSEETQFEFNRHRREI